MKLQEYIKQSERTLNNLGKQLNVLHASLGLSTELGELLDIYKRNIFYKKTLDLVHIKEELGDIMWYLAILYREFDINQENEIINTITKDIVDSQKIQMLTNKINLLVVQLNNLELLNSDHIRRIKYFVPKVYEYIIIFCEIYKFNIEDVMNTNINKLKARFPDKFNEFNALNRDLDLERLFLEA